MKPLSLSPFHVRCTTGFAILPLMVASLGAQTIVPQPPPPDRYAKTEATVHVFKPQQQPAPPLSQLRVPAGFQIQRFAENLGNARVLAISANGTVYVTRREEGDVLKLKVGADGLAEGPPMRVASRPGVHGIAFYEGKVYLATPHEIFRGDVRADGTFGPLEMIIHDLPDAGQHHTRTVQVGPDGMLYIGVGSTTNEANEPNPESATLLRATLDGKSRAVFASGLRDLIGWGWHPVTGELWGMDHGIDFLGDDEQPEELNLIEKGKRYGWPFFYADNKPNAQQDPPGGLSKEEWKRSSVPMVIGYTAHSAPMQLSFYTGDQFPADYKGDAFVSMRGSWNRQPPSGYEIVRIRFKDGRAIKIEPFVTGFVDRKGEYGRLMGNAVAADGSLLFTDDRNGIIYRVSYPTGVKSNTTTALSAMRGPIPAEAMLKQNRVGVIEPLARDMTEMKTSGALTVSSAAFADGGKIPVEYSSYDQNASMPLEWSAGPTGTQSYVVLMEDPDAKSTPLPIVHWVVWNIPADTHGLREGLPPNERLREPKGLRQGANAMGVVGYRGPRPPEGDPAHRYFVQVFALDRMLDLAPGATRQDVLVASAGHVLAMGAFHGVFARPEHPAKP